MRGEPKKPIEAGNDIGRLARDAMDAIGANRLNHAFDLDAAALIEPHHPRPERPAFAVKNSERLALIGDRQCRDLSRTDLQHDLADRPHSRAPPVLRILLPPTRTWIGDRYARASLPARTPLAVPGDRLGRRGRAVDADDEIAGHGSFEKARSPHRPRARPHEDQRSPASSTALSISPATLSMHFLASPP